MSPSFPSISLHSFVSAHICTLLLSSPSLVHLLASLFKLKSYVAPYFLVSEQNKCQISPMHPVVNRLGPFHCAYSAFFSIHRLSCCMHLLMSGHTTLSDRESLPSSTPLWCTHLPSRVMQWFFVRLAWQKPRKIPKCAWANSPHTLKKDHLFPSYHTITYRQLTGRSSLSTINSNLMALMRRLSDILRRLLSQAI